MSIVMMMMMMMMMMINCKLSNEISCTLSYVRVVSTCPLLEKGFAHFFFFFLNLVNISALFNLTMQSL